MELNWKNEFLRAYREEVALEPPEASGWVRLVHVAKRMGQPHQAVAAWLYREAVYEMRIELSGGTVPGGLVRVPGDELRRLLGDVAAVLLWALAAVLLGLIPG